MRRLVILEFHGEGGAVWWVGVERIVKRMNWADGGKIGILKGRDAVWVAAQENG